MDSSNIINSRIQGIPSLDLHLKTWHDTPLSGLVENVELLRLTASREADTQARSELGQFFTPVPISRFMASIPASWDESIRLLDPGAGVGSLSVACVDEILRMETRPSSIHLTLCEIDSRLYSYLDRSIEECKQACERKGVLFTSHLVQGDFVANAVNWLNPQSLFGETSHSFNFAILNPPYRKLNSNSETRKLLRKVGIETSNLYTAFMWLTLKLLEPEGELIAITPRSFCNGPYFRPFREALLSQAVVKRIHVFESRKAAFREDSILQENIILHAAKSTTESKIIISSSDGPDDPNTLIREIEQVELVLPNDQERVIHIAQDGIQGSLARKIRSFSSSLTDLKVNVSTGRVVDFRVKEALIGHKAACLPEQNTAPLIYPMHFDGPLISWPKEGKKPSYLRVSKATSNLLVPPGVYVLVKRFSAKEEKRRISAALCMPSALPDHSYAFENHLNYYHENGQGLPLDLGKGLVAYLNSGIVDSYFRQFSGHTQVNASDLRNLPYPDRDALIALGRSFGERFPSQEELDKLISNELPHVTKDGIDPMNARKKINEALEILKALGLPRAQHNDRSALTLLALCDVKPADAWSQASSPLVGITPIMEFAKKHYGTTYAPNTRETFRRQTMHQFVEAAIAVYNPDKPDRPVNSPKAVYQLSPELLKAIRSFETDSWEQLLATWIDRAGTLKARYAKERQMFKIPLVLNTGKQIELSPGGQNVLVEKIIHEFCPRFTPGGIAIYVGDTEEKYAFFDTETMENLGVSIDSHGKMPDVVIHDIKRNWLLLIEAVTSHGPVDNKRRDELKRLFRTSTAPLVFVTAFMDRAAMVRFLGEISWETEVWVADSPTHMIHFNGERFLGPYDN